MARVLFADDNRNLLTAVDRALRDAGHEVTLADNGADVLAKLNAEPRPDVLILDMVMPVMGGGTVLKCLPPNAPPVVVISAEELEPSELESPLIRRVLTKPFELPELLKAIQDVTDESGLKDTKLDRPRPPDMTDDEWERNLQRIKRYERKKLNGGPAHA